MTTSGFSDGFDVNITSTLARVIPVAVSGDLRKVGIKASVSKLTFGAYRKKQPTGFRLFWLLFAVSCPLLSFGSTHRRTASLALGV